MMAAMRRWCQFSLIDLLMIAGIVGFAVAFFRGWTGSDKDLKAFEKGLHFGLACLIVCILGCFIKAGLRKLTLRGWFQNALFSRKAAHVKATSVLELPAIRDFLKKFPVGTSTFYLRAGYRPLNGMANGVLANWMSPVGPDGQPVFAADEVLTWIEPITNVRIDAVCCDGVVKEYRFSEAPRRS